MIARPDASSIGARHSVPNSALSRYGSAFPSVSAPISKPSAKPRPSLKPARGDFHRRRIHQRQRRAGQEPQANHRRAAGRNEHRRIRRSADQGADEHQHPRVEDVGNVGERAEQRAGDEPGLHRHRQPRRAPGRNVELGDQERRHRGGGKPQRHPQELRQRHNGEHLPRGTRCTLHVHPRSSDLDERNLSFVRDDGVVRADGELRHHGFGEIHERAACRRNRARRSPAGMPRSLPTRIG